MSTKALRDACEAAISKALFDCGEYTTMVSAQLYDQIDRKLLNRMVEDQAAYAARKHE